MNQVTEENFNEILDRVRDHYKVLPKFARIYYIEGLNELLNDMLSKDFFGKDGELDPRKETE